MDDESSIQHFWELAVSAYHISPELSKTMISEMLESIKQADKPIPDYFKKLFCFKCFHLFEVGKNMKISIRSHKKHPNLKIIEYHCLSCQNTQRINAQRSKSFRENPPPTIPEGAEPQPQKRQIQQKRKLFANIFS